MKLHRVFVKLLLIVNCMGCFPVADNKDLELTGEELNQLMTQGIGYLSEFDKGQRPSLLRAKASFEIASKLSANSPLPLDGLACVAFREGDMGLARFLLNQVIENHPDYSRAYSNLAYIESLEGREREAEVLLRKSVELNVLDPQPTNNLGSLLFNSSKPSSQRMNEGRDFILRARELSGSKSELIEKNVKVVSGGT